jgi:hypothetical protein
MSNNTRLPDANNGIVCEAIGCYSKATDRIVLNIGSEITISLFLCTNCKSKLRLGETAENEILEQRNLVNEG